MIHAVTGLNGAGKTSYAAGLLQKWAKKGIRTAANIGVEGSVLVRNFDDLLELRDCILLVDEVTAVASSRQFASLTPEALLFFQTLRHSNIGLIWTAPTYDRCDLALRSLTLYWTHMMAMIKTVPKGGIWSNTHVAFSRSGRPIEGLDGAKMLAPLPGLYFPARHHAVYDSFADVDLFTRSQKFPGRCPGCGASIDYGRLRASTELVTAASFDASFYCPRCATLLGTVNRPVARSGPSVEYSRQAPVPAPMVPVSEGIIPIAGGTASETGWSNDPDLEHPTTAGAEHLPAPAGLLSFDELVKPQRLADIGMIHEP